MLTVSLFESILPHKVEYGVVLLIQRWDSLRESEPFASISEQIETLKGRGLIVRDEDRARHALSVVGYHRLRDYFRPYYVDSNVKPKNRVFMAKASFNSVLNLYYLDRELRFFLLGPLEKLEVSLRGSIIDGIGEYQRGNKQVESRFNLLDPSLYNLKSRDNKQKYVYICKEVLKAAGNMAPKKDKPKFFSALHKSINPNSTYKIISQFAAWPIVHKLSFGPLTQIFTILRPEIAKRIADFYSVTIRVLRSSFEALKGIRNSCAHHEPIWFRGISRYEIPERIKAEIWPSGENISGANTGKEFHLYEICATIHFFLSHVSENTTWYKRLRPLIERFDQDAQRFMGFPDDWSDLRFWRSSSIK